MSLMHQFRSWFGFGDTERSLPHDGDDFWYSDSGLQMVSVRDAMSIPPLSSGIRYLSETLGAMPIHVYRRDDIQGRIIDREHDVYSLVHDQPNETMSAFDFYDRIVKDQILYGGHLSLVKTNANYVVTSIVPFDMANISIRWVDDLNIRSFYDSKTQQSYVDSQVLWIPGPYSTEREMKSTLSANAETLSMALTVRRYLLNYFRKGAIGQIWAHFPNMMSVETKQRWSEYFNRTYAGAANAGSIPVMDGAELKTLSLKHSEMQLVDIQQFYIGEIARILRVPPHKIQDLQRSTNNNIEHQAIESVTDTIRPMAARIEQRLNIALLGPRERMQWYIEFDLDGMLRGDSVAQAQLLSAEHSSAVRTPNEVRRLRNLPRYDDPAADKLYTQGANVPIDLAGKQQAEQAEKKEEQEVRK